MSSRSAYFCELEDLRQEVAKLEKEVALMNPWCCQCGVYYKRCPSDNYWT